MTVTFELAKMEETLEYLDQVVEKLERIVELQNMINNGSGIQPTVPAYPVYPWYIPYQPTYPNWPTYQIGDLGSTGTPPQEWSYTTSSTTEKVPIVNPGDVMKGTKNKDGTMTWVKTGTIFKNGEQV